MIGRWEVKENISSSNWHSYLSQSPWNEEPTYKRKRVGKEILQRAWVHIYSTDYSPEPHITCDSGSGGLNVEAHFFSPRWTRFTISMIHQGSKKPASLVIHGGQNVKRNGPKAIHQAQAPKRSTKPSPSTPNSSLLHKKGLKWIRKREGKWLSHKHHFSLLSWCGARGTEGETFPRKNQISKATKIMTKCWFSSLTNR